MLFTPDSFCARPLILATAAAFLWSLPATAQDFSAAYASDRCVAEKLVSAGDQCKKVLREWSKWEKNRDGNKRNRRIKDARKKLSKSWKKSEGLSSSSGADCRTTTGGSGGLAALIEKSSKAIGKSVDRGLDSKKKKQRKCGANLLKATANLCEDLFEAEGIHIGTRTDDRDRAILSAAREDALGDFGEAFAEAVADGCVSEDEGEGGASADSNEAAGIEEPLEDRIASVVSDAVAMSTVSPRLTGEFEQITPEREVDYAGRTLTPMCWDEAEYSFFVRRGTVNKLLMYYQGGGACWDGLTCGGLPGVINPTFKQGIGENENPANFSSGFADFNNPDNPFKDWHMVFVPYCTGDIHWGDSKVDHNLADVIGGDDRITTVQHRGFHNAQVAEKFAREHFVDPEQVFVSGSSAGAYGAVVHSLSLKEKAYPSTPFAVVGDAGHGVITQEFLENDLGKWGIQKNLPPWIPALDVPLGDLNMTDLYVESAKFYPDSRFAAYTTAFDGGTGGQTGFYNVMVQPNILDWLSWWLSSCDWTDLMRGLSYDGAARAENYRYYIGTGSQHTMWGSNKVYTDTTGGVQTIVDWIDDMLNGTDEEWENVECSDCGVLLDGDTRPGPVGDTGVRPEPFQVEGRITCEEEPA